MDRQTEKRILSPGISGRSRAVVTAQYALMPAEGILASALPGFRGTTAISDDGLEHVFYVVGGTVEFTLDGASHTLAVGGYVFVPVGHSYGLRNVSDEECRVIWIKRPYEPIDLPAPAPIVGKRDDLERNAPHTTGRYWQYLLPTDDLAFDMQVNILGFQPGTYFPYVETHVMEHGLYMLEGQGVYLLAGDWHEVEPTDFIWMAPFCPQDFFCTGWGEAAYLLYKDVNRDVRFD